MKYPTQVEPKLKELAIEATEYLIVVSVSEQKVTLFRGEESIMTYSVSTSEKGTGQVENTMQTPLGLHKVAEKIGETAVTGAVFKGRKDTGEICPPGARVTMPLHDWGLHRCGLPAGRFAADGLGWRGNWERELLRGNGRDVPTHPDRGRRGNPA